MVERFSEDLVVSAYLECIPDRECYGEVSEIKA